MKNLRIYISVFVLILGVAVSYSVLAQELEGETDITFPIAELGNCADKDKCHDYCNESGNMPACIAFAKKHGLMNEAEATKAERFAERVARGEGPGGCRGPRECEAFCSNVSNIEVCIAFAEKHGFEDEHLDEAKKIRTYITSGGTLPGGCSSKDSCEAYCSDFSHAEECFAFAERAGLTIAKGAEKVPPGQFQKFIELAKKGETPGGCKSKNECETYCRDSAHFEECIEFGKKVGFVDEGKADLLRRTGGKGPGGCDSHQSCTAYCNEPANHETCFKFAEEHGLLKEEDLKRAKESFARLRQGLEQAPAEVQACLKSVLGPNIIEEIQSGKLVPGPQIGERVKTCFEKFGESHNPQRAFDKAPPEVLACLRDKFGGDFERVRTGEVELKPEMADAFRVCFQNVQFEKRTLEGESGAPPREIQNFLRTAPPGVQVCLKEKLGTELQALERGEATFGSEVTSRIKSCFEEFRPTDSSLEKPTGVRPETVESSRTFDFGNLPPEVSECVRQLAAGSGERAEIERYVKACYEKLRSNVAPSPTAVPPTSVRPTEEYKQETTTVDPARKCEESGGKWDGSTCVYPQPEGNLLNSVKNFFFR